jgi:hypothetical protein
MSDNTKTRDELTFIELLAEHVFDPSSITETSEDVNILELSEYSTGVPYSGSVTTRSAPSHPLEEPSLVHNNSLMDEEPLIDAVEVEEEKAEPVTEPIVEVEEEKAEPVKVEEIKVDETPVVEEPKGVFNKLTSSLFSICNWFVKK